MRRGLAHLVSDHAVLRWLERVEGLNVETIRQHILSHNVLAELNTQHLEGSEKVTVKHPNGADVVLRSGRVITIMTEAGQKQ